MPTAISFTSTSDRFHLPFLYAGQAQKEFFVNEAISKIDALLHLAIEGIEQQPPDQPTDNTCWIVGDAPVGEWSGHAHAIAQFRAGSWAFTPAIEGMTAFDKSGSREIRFAGEWHFASAPALPTGGTTIDVEAREVLRLLIAGLKSLRIIPA